MARSDVQDEQAPGEPVREGKGAFTSAYSLAYLDYLRGLKDPLTVEYIEGVVAIASAVVESMEEAGVIGGPKALSDLPEFPTLSAEITHGVLFARLVSMLEEYTAPSQDTGSSLPCITARMYTGIEWLKRLCGRHYQIVKQMEIDASVEPDPKLAESFKQAIRLVAEEMPSTQQGADTAKAKARTQTVSGTSVSEGATLGSGGDASDAERHHRRLSKEEEEFRAEILLALEHNRRLPRPEQVTRRKLCELFDIPMKKLHLSKPKKTNLKVIETWSKSLSGKRYLDGFWGSPEGRLWMKKLEKEWPNISRNEGAG